MRCGYCYYLHAESAKTSAAVMSDEVLEAFIRKYIEESPGPTVSFTWHGGEPTLAGLPFYQKVLALQHKYLPEDWQVWNNLQTNGLLLDDTWCDFLKENHFDVGISIDGTAALHDYYRKSATLENTYQRTFEAIQRLKSRGIQPDLLCTVNAKTAQNGKEVYRALRDLSTGWMQFIPIVVKLPVSPKQPSPGAPAPASDRPSSDAPNPAPSRLASTERPLVYRLSEASVMPEAYGNFLKDVFFEWFFHDLGRTEVQLFSETARALAGKTPTLCTMAPACGNVLIVEKDGSVFSCDHFVQHEYRIGNVLDDSFQELLASPFQTRFANAKTAVMSDRCRSCEYLPLCGGGCQKDRFYLDTAAGGDLSKIPPYVLCEGLRSYFDYAVPRLKDAMSLSARGMAPDAIMRELSGKERQKFRGIGRNDLCPCGSGLKFKYCCQKRVP